MRTLNLLTGVSLLWASVIACAPASTIEVAPALSVVDSFPGNGTRLPAAAATRIELVFSELVDGEAALASIKLASLTEGDQVKDPYDLYPDIRRGEGGLDEQTRSVTLVFDPDPENELSLPADERFRIEISKGLLARNGSVLPVDVFRYFSTSQ